MDVSTITPATQATGQSTGQSAGLPATTASARSTTAKLSTDFETFLKMLTTQMQNQDPTNPIDSSDFAVQLATFSGVEQQVKTNDLLTSLTARLGSSSLTDLAGWVGMEARAAAPAYFHGDPVTVWPQPDAAADTAQVVVKNDVGAEVGRYQIAASTDPVSWSGIGTDGNPLPDGLYIFQVESYQAGALIGTRQAEVYALITEARVEDGETMLVLLGDTKIKTADVDALRNQP